MKTYMDKNLTQWTSYCNYFEMQMHKDQKYGYKHVPFILICFVLIARGNTPFVLTPFLTLVKTKPYKRKQIYPTTGDQLEGGGGTFQAIG